MSRGGGDGGYDRRTVLASVLGVAATPAVSGVGGATDGTAAAVGRGSATEWSMHRADAANTAANRAGGTVEPPLAERWRSGPLFSFGRRVVSTDGRRVFVTNRGPDDARFSLRARSAADGALQWEFAPADGTVTGTPAVARDAVFAGGDALYAVAAEDGSEQFRFDAGGDVGIPVVADGTVLVAADGTLRAVDAATGDEQ